MFVFKAVRLAFQVLVFSTVALVTSLPAHLSPPTSLSRISVLPNATLPFNLTLLNPISNDLPSDPFFFQIPQTTLLLRCHNYGPPLPPTPTYRTLQTAVEDVLMHIWRDPSEGNVPMAPLPQEYVYGANSVKLLFRPQKAMTWGMWGNTLRGLRLFGEVWEFVGLDYDVWDGKEGKRVLGSGHLGGGY